MTRVLDTEPDLGHGIAEEQWKLAEAAAIAPTFDFECGAWGFLPQPDPAGFGALILAGMMIVRLEAGLRSHVELLGEGDLVSPWVSSGQDLAIPSMLNASVIAPLRVALLDRRFALRTARWPEIHAAVLRRLITRTRRLSLQAAINGVPRIEERLELTLWELGNRFGRVTRDGILFELPVTHEQLAGMVAAQRPSVSTAIGRLQADGRVVRTGRHRWLLPGEPPETLLSLARESGLAT